MAATSGPMMEREICTASRPPTIMQTTKATMKPTKTLLTRPSTLAKTSSPRFFRSASMLLSMARAGS
ncbi:MAG: hypothetical protein JF607_04640 [Burkholderiales bacterium]|nr:hypothetical protein [Burkholderiales bacterium]